MAKESAELPAEEKVSRNTQLGLKILVKARRRLALTVGRRNRDRGQGHLEESVYGNVTRIAMLPDGKEAGADDASGGHRGSDGATARLWRAFFYAPPL